MSSTQGAAKSLAASWELPRQAARRPGKRRQSLQHLYTCDHAMPLNHSGRTLKTLLHKSAPAPAPAPAAPATIVIIQPAPAPAPAPVRSQPPASARQHTRVPPVRLPTCSVCWAGREPNGGVTHNMVAPHRCLLLSRSLLPSRSSPRSRSWPRSPSLRRSLSLRPRRRLSPHNRWLLRSRLWPRSPLHQSAQAALSPGQLPRPSTSTPMSNRWAQRGVGVCMRCTARRSSRDAFPTPGCHGRRVPTMCACGTLLPTPALRAGQLPEDWCPGALTRLLCEVEGRVVSTRVAQPGCHHWTCRPWRTCVRVLQWGWMPAALCSGTVDLTRSCNYPCKCKGAGRSRRVWRGDMPDCGYHRGQRVRTNTCHAPVHRTAASPPQPGYFHVSGPA